MSDSNTSDKANPTYQLLAQELGSVSLPLEGPTVAVFRPLEGEANDTYRAALVKKLDVVFGKSAVTVGNAIKNGGIEVTIPRGTGFRARLADIMSRDGENER